jgi:hypothetical protein
MHVAEIALTYDYLSINTQPVLGTQPVPGRPADHSPVFRKLPNECNWFPADAEYVTR